MADRFFSLTTEDKQSALEDAWDVTPDDGSLRHALREFEKSSRASGAGGTVLQQSASNGHMAAAFAPGLGAPAPVEYARVWRELINLFDEVTAWLKSPVVDDGGTVPDAIEAPTDEQVYNQMRGANDYGPQLRKVTEARSDYRNLRSGGVW